MPCGRPRPSCGSIPWSYCGKDRRDVHHECKGAVQPESIHLAALVCGTRWRLPILLACAHALRTPILSFASSTRMSRMRSAQCCVAVGGDSPEALRALELFRKVASPAAVQVIEDFMAGRTTEAYPADAPRTLDEFLLAELHRPAKRGEGDRLVPTGPFVTEWQAFARGAMGKDRATVQSPVPRVDAVGSVWGREGSCEAAGCGS